MAWAGEGFARGLIFTCRPPYPLFNIYHSKFDNSHISIWQLTNTELRPIAPSPFFFYATRGLLEGTHRSATQSLCFQGPWAGEGQIKASLAPSIFPCSPQISLTAGSCRAKPPPSPTRTLFTIWGHRPTINPPLPFHQGHIVREQWAFK